MKVRDAEGEVEVAMKDGKRVLTAKNAQGDVTFTGPVDSPEERNAIPEPIRRKLSSMAPPPVPPEGAPQSIRPRPFDPPFGRSEREPDIQ